VEVKMSEAIEDLKHEHEAITSALGTLTSIIKSISKPEQRTNWDDLSRFLSFLSEFADKCHHGKEEGILFPAIKNAGIQDAYGPIEVMLSEHTRGRKYIQEMTEIVSQRTNQKQFVQYAREYSDLLSQHILKENDILFQIAEKDLSKKELEKIYTLFEEHEEKVIGHGRHEELHTILKELKKKYQD
jgi:hemerythrin-like domain-containing protein